MLSNYFLLSFRVVFYTLLGIFALNANFFGLSDKGDEAFQYSFYRYIAPFIYESEAKDEILVVLINDNAIKDLYERGIISANEWPLLYKDHSKILNTIISQQPASILVDIYFKQERSTDKTLQFFQSTFRRANKYGVPINFGITTYEHNITSIQKYFFDHAQLALIGWQGHGDAYPVTKSIEILDKPIQTAAVRLFADYCLRNEASRLCEVEAFDKDLSVIWDDSCHKNLYKDSCSNNENNIIYALKGIFGIEQPHQKSPAQHYIYADDLIYRLKNRDLEVQRLIKDKVVIYGLNLEGLHDHVDSPYHGKLPGSFFHAMALDNIFTLQSDTIKKKDNVARWLGYLIWSIIVILALVVQVYANKPSDQIEGVRKKFSIIYHRNFRVTVYLISLVPIFLGLILSFFFFRYEPLDFLNYFAMSALLAELMKQKLGHKVFNSFISIKEWCYMKFTRQRNNGEVE